MMISILAKLVATPLTAAATATAVLGGGGLAYAATQGAVPFAGHHRPVSAPASPAASKPGLAQAANEPVGSDDAPEGTEGAEPADAPAEEVTAAHPTPSLAGLCHAYQAGAAAVNHTNPAFGALTTAAGGEDQVAAYCTNAIGASKKPQTPGRRDAGATPPKLTRATSHPTRPTRVPTRPAEPAQPTQPAQVPSPPAAVVSHPSEAPAHP